MYWQYLLHFTTTFSGAASDKWCSSGCAITPDPTGHVDIPSNWTTVGNGLFNGCTSLTSVTIGNNVTSIGRAAFSGCSGLTSVTIGNNVTSIGDEAFSGCSGLTSVTIGNSVTSIGDGTFSECSGLTSVTIGNSVTSIGRAAFSECSGLTSVTIGNSVTSIGDIAFYLCISLTSVTIGNSVTSIGNSAFSECSGLTSVTIPDSVTSIGDKAFSECSKLSTLRLSDNLNTLGNHAFARTGVISVVLPDSLKALPTYAFLMCRSLESVIFGKYLEKINSHAFSGDIKLKSISLPPDLILIDMKAFQGCLSIKTVVIPPLVQQIGQDAFTFNNLESIEIKTINSVLILESAFSANLNLKNVTIWTKEIRANPGLFSHTLTIPVLFFSKSTALIEGLLLNLTKHMLVINALAVVVLATKIYCQSPLLYLHAHHVRRDLATAIWPIKDYVKNACPGDTVTLSFQAYVFSARRGSIVQPMVQFMRKRARSANQVSTLKQLDQAFVICVLLVVHALSMVPPNINFVLLGDIIVLRVL